jgi:hydroxypyruvate isomerase
MPRFSANVSTLFNEVPFLERFKAAADVGFSGVECQFPYDHELSAVADAVAMADVKFALINAPAGDFAAGDRGFAALKGEEKRFKESVETALRYAEFLECPLVHVLSGNASSEDADAVDTYISNLIWAADNAQDYGIRVVIEPILMEGYFLDRPSKALAVLEHAPHENLGLQYDLYHAQRCEGGLSEFIEENLNVIAHIQVAGVPERHEPDKYGEVNWRFIFDLLDSHGYDGWVGAEYTPRGDTRRGLGWAKDWGISGAS